MRRSPKTAGLRKEKDHINIVAFWTKSHSLGKPLMFIYGEASFQTKSHSFVCLEQVTAVSGTWRITEKSATYDHPQKETPESLQKTCVFLGGSDFAPTQPPSIPSKSSPHAVLLVLSRLGVEPARMLDMEILRHFARLGVRQTWRTRRILSHQTTRFKIWHDNTSSWAHIIIWTW